MIEGRQTYIALNRFGFGASLDEVTRIVRMGGAARWLEDQIRKGASNALMRDDTLRSSAETLDEWQQAQAMKKSDKKQKIIRQTRKKQREEFMSEMHLRLQKAVESRYPFAERLVHFWSNHFTVSGKAKAIITGMLGAYEREAIRPHVFSSFEDMLLAAETHPAMLIYLDNHQSIGPNSPIGKRRKRGLNENLAREIMELHTLGVNGGYTQRDVTEFAKIITGWSVRGAKQDGAAGYRFNYGAHEPGAKYVMGVQYGSPEVVKNRQQAEFLAQQEGRMALKDFARHPSTAKFIATKLARHFIADNPPPAAIKALTNSFIQSRGYLPDVYRTLIGIKEIWQQPLPKYKPPYDYIVTVFRMLGVSLDDNKAKTAVKQALTMMDHVPFMALSPAGWGDVEGEWLSPDSLMNRIEWGHSLAGRYQRQILVDDPSQFAERTIGALLSAEEMTAIKRAPSKADAISLALLSPAALRR